MNIEIINPTIFAKNLKHLMDERKITQKDVEKETGISQASISRYLRPGASPTKVNVMALALFFEVSLPWLARGSGSKYRAIAEKEPNEMNPISAFQDKNLARYLCKILLEIETLDIEILRREIKSYLEGSRDILKASKKIKKVL